jgi:tetratricopeptide (TPR) repeat protein
MIRLTKGGLIKWGSQAGAELARAKQLSPEDDPYYYYVCGRSAIFSPALFGGSYRAAVEFLSRGAELDPSDPLMATWFAIALGKQGETKRAKDVLTKAVERWPRFQHAQRVLKRLDAGEELIPET